jgi:hypothetical protein
MVCGIGIGLGIGTGNAITAAAPVFNKTRATARKRREVKGSTRRKDWKGIEEKERKGIEDKWNGKEEKGREEQ